MIVHWLPLVVALAFGLFPPLRLLNSECRYLPFDEIWTRVITREKDSQRRRRWWKLPLVWIDPFRGYVVGVMLSQSFAAAPRVGFLQSQLPLFSLFALIFIVLGVQTKGRPYERESLSPAGFMAGLMLAMMPPVVAIGSIVVGGATAIALQGYVAGYLAAAVMTAGLGVAFVGKNPKLIGLFVMVAAPVWISWLRRSNMVTPVRC